MDFAEEESKLEHLAVRFKLAETRAEFEKVFKQCQVAVAEKPASGDSKTSNNVPKVTRAKLSGDEGEDTEGEDNDGTESYGEEDEDSDEEGGSVMFANQCQLFEKADEQEKLLGRVDIKIVYDDDVYGARIVATKQMNEADEEEDEDEEDLCNHLIAMQTQLEYSENRCSWSALDFSSNPPAYRNFVAVFDSDETQLEFKENFFEGKELAEQSEILEQAEGEHDDDDYYGD